MFFCTMHSIRVFFENLNFFVFIKNASQVAILNIEHSKILHLVAY